MIAQAPYGQSQGFLPVGDLRRRTAGRAVLSCLWVAALFEIFTLVTKEIPSLYSQIPWANDPYDTTVSFAIFFIPTVMAFSSIRLFLCKGNEPLPVARLDDLVRGCRLVLVMVFVTLVSNWISLAFAANRSQWGSQTGWMVGVMGVLTVVTCTVIWDIYRVPRFSFISRTEGTRESDWVSDTVTLLRLGSIRLGPLQKPFVRLIDWIDLHILPGLRRNPLKGAFALSLIFGVFVALSQVRESGFSLFSLLFLSVSASGMFAFLALSGAYLGIVRRHRFLKTKEQRLVDAIVLASAAVPISLAFRNSLWWVIGSNESSGHLAQLSSLLIFSAVGVFLAVLVFETIAGVHADRN